MPVLFYHLTRSPAAAIVTRVAERALERGWRVAVRGTDAERLRALDAALWGPGPAWLPHGLAEAPHAADQPVLLTTGDAANGATCVLAVDGAALDPAEAAALDRACVVFDGTDPAAVEAARGQWRALAAAGVGAQYWSEASGRWAMTAEAG